MMDNRARDEAAQWFVRLQDAELSVEERQRFDTWRAEQPEHQYEFDVLQGLWSATDLLPKARLQALCETPVERPKRRAVLRYAVAASVVAVRVWPASAYTRVTIESTAPLAFSQFSLKDPERLVVDMEGIDLNNELQTLSNLDVDCVVLKDAAGKVLFSSPGVSSFPASAW